MNRKLFHNEYRFQQVLTKKEIAAALTLNMRHIIFVIQIEGYLMFSRIWKLMWSHSTNNEGQWTKPKCQFRLGNEAMVVGWWYNPIILGFKITCLKHKSSWDIFFRLRCFGVINMMIWCYKYKYLLKSYWMSKVTKICSQISHDELVLRKF